MKSGLAATALLTVLLLPGVCSAQSGSLEVTALSLNRLVGRLGVLSDGGVYQGTTVWRWSVTGAHFTLNDGSMTFTATVRVRVGAQLNTETRTVPASVSFDSTPAPIVLGGRVMYLPRHALRINIGSFTVPVQAAGSIVTQVDVAKLYAMSVPIEPQELSVSLPGGGTRTVTARVVGINPHYVSGMLIINIDVEF